MFRHMGDGLYRHMKGLDGFPEEFGYAFESYVGRVLRSFHEIVGIYDEAHLMCLASNKSCDYLVELTDMILLVETKAVSFVKTVLTEKSVSEDSSTRRIAEGIRQLYATARDLEIGKYDSLNIDKSKPLLGVVVTFGDVPLVNSKWYFDTFILSHATRKLEQPIYPSELLTRRTFSVSVRTLEQLVIVCNSKPTSPLHLYDEKTKHSDISIGDWDTWISHMLNAMHEEQVEPLPFTRPQTANLLTSMGVPPEMTEKSIGSRGGPI